MSSSDAQPPLTRRQARERERAVDGGAQPVTPPPTVAAPASAAEEPRRRPGSHVAPAASAPAQSAAPSVPDLPPASATEIVPGTGMTRRQLRALRAAEQQAVQPVPLQAPTPQSSDRTVADVLGTVRAIEDGSAPAAQPGGSTDVPESTPDTQAVTPADPAPRRSVPAWASASAPAQPVQQASAPEPSDAPVEHHLPTAAVEQATSADGSPDEIESLDEAAAHAEEPRRRRSTWAAHDEEPAEQPVAEQPVAEQPVAEQSVPSVPSAPEQSVPAVPATRSVDDTARAVEPNPGASTPIVPSLPSAPSPRTPGVFPLDLDGDDTDTNEVPVRPTAAQPDPAEAAAVEAAPVESESAQPAAAESAPVVPAAQERPVEPKPITTAFSPSSHWSQEDDSEIHDAETGVRRVADTRTNAIILPNSALGDVTGALNATGEVILTGSIDLPKSLSSTGSHRPIDGAEVDRLLDQQDEQPETDASPVRASRAVSSHTSTRQVVLAAAKPQKQSRVPVVLAVSAASVGVAAAALIVAAVFVFNGN